MDMIRWGILGTGYMAAAFAADISRANHAELRAVASRDDARATDFARRVGSPVAYGSYEALVADSQIDLVYVATPHSHHYEHARLALAHGKAVLVEKPFTMTGDQSADLVELARRTGSFLMEAMWTLCNPLVLDLVDRVRMGQIGIPRMFAANVGPIGLPLGSRLEDPSQGGSALLECHVYPLTLAAALAPALVEPHTIHAASTFTARGTDDLTSFILHSDSGVVTVAGGIAIGAGGQAPSRVQLIGTDGWLQLDDSLYNPSRALLSSHGKEPVVLTDRAAERGYAWEIEEAGRALNAGLLESELVPLDRTVAIMRLLDRIGEAAGVTLA